MVWPNNDAAVADVWPTVADLEQWLRNESVTASSTEVVADAFRSADQLIRAELSTDLLTAKAADAGIITDPDAVGYVEATLHAWCPAYVRQAILIRAASIYSRRDSTNGTISFGEFATRVAKMDPDVANLLSPVRKPAVA